MAKFERAKSEAEFRHGTTIGVNGETLYDCPVIIKNSADLNNYGITDDDCRYLKFSSSQKIRVYFYKTPNRALADEQWKYINSLHSTGYSRVRCMVPGKRKAFIRCRDTNKCSACPYGRNPKTKQAPIISLDVMLEEGLEPGASESVENQVIAKIEYEGIKAVMDAEDPRIAKALEMKVLQGYSVNEIAAELGVSQPRVYQLIARAKAIGKEYREING